MPTRSQLRLKRTGDQSGVIRWFNEHHTDVSKLHQQACCGTYVGPLKPNSNNAGWSVDVKKYHICHSWSTWNLNLGLMFRSYFDDFNHTVGTTYEYMIQYLLLFTCYLSDCTTGLIQHFQNYDRYTFDQFLRYF